MYSIIHRLGWNTVWVSERERKVVTTLHDGLQVHAVPHPTPEYLELALRHGYGWADDPAWAMCREHDLMHTLLAMEMDLEESPTLRDVAEGRALEHVGHGGVPDYQWLEEGRVMDLQLYLNTGDKGRSEHGGAIHALSWEIPLESFRTRVLAFLRESQSWRER